MRASSASLACAKRVASVTATPVARPRREALEQLRDIALEAGQQVVHRRARRRRRPAAAVAARIEARPGWRRAELPGIGLRLVVLRLDRDDGHRLRAAVDAGEVDEEQAVALGEDADATRLVGLPAGGASERGQLGPKPVGAIHRAKSTGRSCRAPSALCSSPEGSARRAPGRPTGRRWHGHRQDDRTAVPRRREATRRIAASCCDALRAWRARSAASRGWSSATSTASTSCSRRPPCARPWTP